MVQSAGRARKNVVEVFMHEEPYCLILKMEKVAKVAHFSLAIWFIDFYLL